VRDYPSEFGVRALNLPLFAGNPEGEEDEGRDEGNHEIERDHVGRLAPAVAQPMSLHP
jgi:hypothetical protein